MGLMKSIHRYNASKHGSFVSYFPLWVMQYMQRTVADKSRLIRIPVHKLATLTEELHEYVSLKSLADIGEDGYLEFNFSDFVSESVDESIVHNQSRKHIEEALDSLKLREADVLKLRYGLDDDTERTLEEVGYVYNLTRERIRQIEAKALKKLRHPTRSEELKAFY